MRWLPLAVVLSVLGVSPALADSCVTCHQELPEPLGTPVEGMKADVHARAGLSCADCHGGDPSDEDVSAMDEAKGFVGRPEPAAIPAFCGRCHADESYMRRFNPALRTDQLAEYGTSVHGQRLATGDTKVATCVSCHGVHGILPASDARSPVYPATVAKTCAACHADPARMAGYGLPTDQFAKYQQSVHGRMLLENRDLSAPTCNDCHGNHGAYPPGVTSIAAVCGQCHASNKAFYLESPHRPAFAKLGLPECAACHGNHEVHPASDEMLGVGGLAICIGCHVDGSPGYLAARRMRAAIDELRDGIDDAAATLARAQTAGMEVSEAVYELQSAREELVRSRNAVHAFDPDALVQSAGAGTKTALAAGRVGEAALVELSSRRWMAIIPLAAIAVVAGLLWLRIRDLGNGET